MKEKRNNKASNLARRLLGLWLLACLVFLVAELCNKRSILALGRFILERPQICALNIIIIYATLLCSEMFARRRSVITLVTLLWLGFGVTNLIMIIIRVLPFTFADIAQLKHGIALVTLYFKWWQIILLFGGILVLIIALVLLFTKVKKSKVNRPRGIIVCATGITVCVMLCVLCVRGGYLPRRFDNLVDAYEEYGFVYCFTGSVVQSGIDQPEDYSEDLVEEILEELPANTTPQQLAAEGGQMPNVLFVQMESFFDMHRIKDTVYSEDPHPNFTQLYNQWPSAALYVPVVGGGTANTEFEVLTGMCLDFFGAGEYPYNTVLQNTTCETVSYVMAQQGYSTTAMHNYTATFYDRNDVYSRLGFDRFVSLEYMQNAKYNTLGWCSDSVLVDEAMQAMQATPQRDFVFAITVQTHGKYADEPLSDNTRITVPRAVENIYAGQLANFANALYRTDAFIGELMAALEQWDEPSVVVFYGDHLPAVGLEAEMLQDGDLYKTEYVIWNNYGAEFTARDLQAYQLYAYVLEQLGIEGGVVTRYHQSAEYAADEEYLRELEILEYDLLYGEQEAYNGVNPYVPTQLVMGSRPITLKSAVQEYGRLLVKGSNFTEFSVIVADDDALNTVFVDENTLVSAEEVSPSAQISVAQRTRDGRELSRTEPVEIQQ